MKQTKNKKEEQEEDREKKEERVKREKQFTKWKTMMREYTEDDKKLPIDQVNKIYVESYWDFYSKTAPFRSLSFFDHPTPNLCIDMFLACLWGEFPLEQRRGELFQGRTCSPPGL